jgi:glycyl-tRNA synthetase beta chain
MSELLIELFCEEIPAMMQGKAALGFNEICKKYFEEYNLRHASVQVFIGPRRISIVALGMSKVIEPKEEELKGPKVDAPIAAIEGFCRSNNIQKEQLSRIRIKDQDFFAYLKKSPESKTTDLLLEIIPKILGEYVWPKSMYWGSYNISWVRPLKNILCLFDGQVVPVTYGHLTANDITYGHRFYAPSALKVSNFEDYERKLASNGVIISGEKRKELIISGLKNIISGEGLELLEDEKLLEEVIGLVEYPNAMMGKIPEKFLELPKEVLITSMRTHQRYFSVVDEDGNLAPYFLFVSNSVEGDEDLIVAGNEKVLSARLSDALYFYFQDQKSTLNSRIEKLENIVFHAKLGNLREKVERVSKICQHIAPQNKTLEIAAQICKSDLTSEMVGEFAELQGVMGYYYAVAEGLGDDIAGSVKDHYKPQGASDSIPEGNAAMLAIADKLDSLVGLQLAGEQPTGSKDPYALRRLALGIIRIILDNKLHLNINAVVEFVVSLFDLPKSNQNILLFLEDRAKFYFKSDYPIEIVNAILDLKLEPDLLTSSMKLEALKRLLETSEGEKLLSGYKRVSNILSNNTISGIIDPTLFRNEYEKLLYQKINQTRSELEQILKQNNFQEALKVLAGLAAPIADFFEHVMVMDNEEKVARNRLMLLSHVKDIFTQIARFDHL